MWILIWKIWTCHSVNILSGLYLQLNLQILVRFFRTYFAVLVCSGEVHNLTKTILIITYKSWFNDLFRFLFNKAGQGPSSRSSHYALIRQKKFLILAARSIHRDTTSTTRWYHGIVNVVSRRGECNAEMKFFFSLLLLRLLHRDHDKKNSSQHYVKYAVIMCPLCRDIMA